MRWLYVLVIMVPLTAFAGQPVSINLSSSSLVSFAQTTYKNLLGRDFVITPDALALDRKISVSVRSIDIERLPVFVEGVLADQGLSTELRDGVYYVRVSKISAQTVPAASSDFQLVPAPHSSSVAPVVAAQPVSDVVRSAGYSSAHAIEPGMAPDADAEAYQPLRRPVDFLVQVIVAAFGQRSAVAAGGQVVLAGTPAQLKKMRALAAAIDQPSHMVDVSASWVEVTDSAGDQQGISVAASVLGATLSGSMGWIGSNAITLKGRSFSVVLDALKTDGRFRQVSNSRVVGDDYEKMLLTVGDETPTIGSTGSDNSGNAVQNVVYRQSGVIVEVLPKVLGGGRLSLAIDGQISSFKATQTGVTGSPTLIKRQVKTNVTVADSEVIVIGGLNDSQNDDRSAGLSFLPSSWSLKNRSRKATDLVLILSARVVNAEPEKL